MRSTPSSIYPRNLLLDSNNLCHLQTLLKKSLQRQRFRKTSSLKDIKVLIDQTDILREQMFSLQNLSYHDFALDVPEKSSLSPKKHTNTVMVDDTKVKASNRDLYEQIRVYKQVTWVIEQQISEKNNPLGDIVRLF